MINNNINIELDKFGIITGDNLFDLLKIENVEEKTYNLKYKDRFYSIKYYFDGVKITDLTEAGKVGKKVNSLFFEFNNNKSVNEIFYTPFENFYIILLKNSIDDFVLCSDFEKIKMFLYSEKATNYINKNDLTVYKKLDKKPTKWTKLHIIRALINKQYKNLKCDGIYTDDYSWDAEVNFQKGEIKNTIEFCEKLNSVGGWRIYESNEKENIINVDCHDFNYNSFELVL